MIKPREFIINNLKNYDYVLLDNGALVNEKLKTCIIITDTYGSDEIYDNLLNIQSELMTQYRYAEKSTILMILDDILDKDKIRNDQFNFLKIFIEDMGAIPLGMNLDITVTFVCGYNGDYNIDPNKSLSRNIIDYMTFIALLDKDVSIGYPKIISGSTELHFLRHIAKKRYNVKY